MMNDPAVRRDMKLRRSGELAQRIGRGRGQARAAADAGASGKGQMTAMRGAMRGRMPTTAFPELEIKPEAIDSLYKKIAAGGRGEDTPLTDLDALQAEAALDTIFLEQAIPNRSQMLILEKAFGPQFTQALNDLKPYGLKSLFSDVMNLPRAVLASGDMSGTLRQSILALGLGPKDWKRFAKGGIKSAKAFADPAYAREIDDLVRGASGSADQKVVSNALQRWGVEFTGSSVRPEEAFQMGQFAKKFLGSNEAGRLMLASDRSYQTMGNYLRFANGEDSIISMAKLYGKQGDTFEKAVKRIPFEEGELLAKTLNVITGRSGLKVFKNNSGWAKALNAGFFAPNFLASRALAPTLLPARIIQKVRANPSVLNVLNDPKALLKLYQSDPIMQLQAKSLGGFIAQGAAMLALLKGASAAGFIPDFEINTDPRSSDFGKGRVGSTRIDFWGGYAPMVRGAVRIITGEQTSISGNTFEVGAGEVIWDQFVRSKVAPIPGLLWDAKTGTDFKGDKVEYNPDSIDAQVAQALTPLFIQDVIEGFRENGTAGALATAPASFFGYGANTFESIGEIKNNVAQEMYGSEYRDLTGPKQRIVDQTPQVLDKDRESILNPTASFVDALQAIEDERLVNEDIIMARLQNGQITRDMAATALSEQQLTAAAKRDEAKRQFGIQDVETTSMLQQGLQQWRNLYELSDWGYAEGVKTGEIDWDKYTALEAELFKTLTPEQVEYIELQNPSPHSPMAQVFYDNRNYVKESGFNDIADEEFQRMARRVAAIDPDITSYGQLLAALDYYKLSNPALYKRLNEAKKAVSKRVDARKERLRKANPELDAALFSLGRTDVLLTRRAHRLAGGQ